MFGKLGFAHARASALLLAGALLAVMLMSAAPAFAQEGSERADGAEGIPPVGQVVKWSDFTGAPAIPPATVGLWVWSEDVSGQEVLRIRTGSDGSSKTFTGVIITNRAANFYDAALVNETGDDSLSTPDYNRIEFSLATTGGGEGIDVNWSGMWLFLDLKINGAYVPGNVFTGAAAKPTTGAPLGVRAGRDGLLALPLSMLDGPTPFVLNAPNGYYLARSEGRYHLRLTATSETDLVDYRGHILVERGRFRAVKEFLGDPRDFVRITGRGKVVDFRFLTMGHIDGMDWVVNGPDTPDNMVFRLKMNGSMAAPNIALGSEPFGTVKAFTFRLVE
jgi:hypothetical protein